MKFAEIVGKRSDPSSDLQVIDRLHNIKQPLSNYFHVLSSNWQLFRHIWKLSNKGGGGGGQKVHSKKKTPC